jgi:predicted ester cyclase
MFFLQQFDLILMNRNISSHISSRVPYWFRSQGQYSLEHYISDTLSEMLGRFVDTNDEMCWYGHDISQAVQKSHPLISAYADNDESKVKKELSSIVSNSLSEKNERFKKSSKFVNGNLRKYGARKGLDQPIFPSDITKPEDAILRIWFEANHEVEKYKSLDSRRTRFSQVEDNESNNSLENYTIMNKRIRKAFPDPSKFSHFLNDAILTSELTPYVATWLNPENRKDTGITPTLLPYFLVVGYETLKGVIDHSVTSMNTGILREVYKK